MCRPPGRRQNYPACSRHVVLDGVVRCGAGAVRYGFNVTLVEIHKKINAPYRTARGRCGKLEGKMHRGAVLYRVYSCKLSTGLFVVYLVSREGQPKNGRYRQRRDRPNFPLAGILFFCFVTFFFCIGTDRGNCVWTHADLVASTDERCIRVPTYQRPLSRQAHYRGELLEKGEVQ